MKEEFIQKIQRSIQGEVAFDQKTLKEHAHDASMFEIMPELVVYPKNSADIQELVKLVSLHKPQFENLSITPRSAGTCMAGGPLTSSISLDVTKHLNDMGQVDTENKTLIAQPGVYYRDFEEKTLQHNLIYPAYPASKSIAAMGGIVGNNGAGEKTLRYGKAEDYVSRLNVVLSDGNEYEFKPLSADELGQKKKLQNFEGEVYGKMFDLLDTNYDAIKAAKPHVSKNSAGYYLWNVWDREAGVFDLTKLFTGSQGTLGVITEIEMKLVEKPRAEKLVAVFLDSTEELGDIVQTIRSHNAESIEAYDDKTIRLALRFWKGFIKKRGFFGAVKLGLQFLPELFMMLTGLPKLVLLVNFTGDEDRELWKRSMDLVHDLEKFPHVKTRITKSASDAEKFWTIRHDSFALLREHFQDKKTAPFIDDVIVPPEVLPEFLPKIQEILDRENLSYNIHGHAGNGNFHLVPLLDFSQKLTSDLIIRVAKEVYELVLSYGGSITAEHNDGIIRTPFLPMMYGQDMVDLFQQTKDIFDPRNIFNPGKKVGGTIDDISKYLTH